jgi:hypothetical protein
MFFCYWNSHYALLFFISSPKDDYFAVTLHKEEFLYEPNFYRENEFWNSFEV